MKKKKLKMDKRSVYQRELYAKKKRSKGLKAALESKKITQSERDAIIPDKLPEDIKTSPKINHCISCQHPIGLGAVVIADMQVRHEQFCARCNTTWDDVYEFRKTVQTGRFE